LLLILLKMVTSFLCLLSSGKTLNNALIRLFLVLNNTLMRLFCLNDALMRFFGFKQCFNEIVLLQRFINEMFWH
jgi:hypothetical protein